MSEHAEEEEEENVELGHMQEVIPGLWLGDIIAAMDEESLKAANIVSLSSPVATRCSSLIRILTQI